MNIYTNPLNLPLLTIESRMFPIDPSATAVLYVASIIDSSGNVIGYRNRVGINSSILTDQQIVNSLSNPMTQAEQNAINRAISARTNAKNIPNWASYSATEALDWMQTNIGTPLDTPLPTAAQLGNTTTLRNTLSTLVDIMKKQNMVDKAIAQMVIALRDDTWPNLADV